MERFYKTLCIACVILDILCIPFHAMRFGVLFFSTLAVCTGAMWVLIRHKRHVLVRIGNVIFALWLISMAIVQGLIFSGSHTDPEALQADCIFVLGSGIHKDQPTRTLRNRLAAALDIMQQNPYAHIIVCGGQGDDELYTEASVMFTWMTEHGADPNRITIEGQSRNTIQNIENAMEICRINGWDTENAAILSNGFHLYRTRHIMEKCGLKPLAIAAPSGNPAMHIMFCIREYFSIIKLIVKGYW